MWHRLAASRRVILSAIILAASAAAAGEPKTSPPPKPAEASVGEPITGIVLDPAGAPVAGCKVWLRIHRRDYVQRVADVIDEMTTDSQGRFTFRNVKAKLPLPMPVWLPVIARDANGRVGGHKWFPDFPPLYRAEEIRIRLAEVQTYRGRIEDSSGHPIAKATIQPNFCDPFPRRGHYEEEIALLPPAVAAEMAGESGPDGAFVLRGVPANGAIARRRFGRRLRLVGCRVVAEPTDDASARARRQRPRVVGLRERSEGGCRHPVATRRTGQRLASTAAILRRAVSDRTCRSPASERRDLRVRRGPTGQVRVDAFVSRRSPVLRRSASRRGGQVGPGGLRDSRSPCGPRRPSVAPLWTPSPAKASATCSWISCFRRRRTASGWRRPDARALTPKGAIRPALCRATWRCASKACRCSMSRLRRTRISRRAKSPRMPCERHSLEAGPHRGRRRGGRVGQARGRRGDHRPPRRVGPGRAAPHRPERQVRPQRHRRRRIGRVAANGESTHGRGGHA